MTAQTQNPRSSDAARVACMNLRTKEYELINVGFVHSAGFPCPDFSSLNVNRGDYSIDDLTGTSAKTFNDCMSYLKMQDPPLGFYENAVDLVNNNFNCEGMSSRSLFELDHTLACCRHWDLLIKACSTCFGLLKVVVDNLFV
jgi:hypothetical protein